MPAADLFIFDSDLLLWMLLAFGAALVVGNLAALLRPPADLGDGVDDVDGPTVERPSAGRVLVLVVIGLLASVWAIASLAR